jgi:DNA polymerase III subunit epsilon
MTWWSGVALGFDTESDDVEPTEARIIEGALVHLTPGSAPREMGVLLQPEREIPEGAVSVHGITTERAREEGVLREIGVGQIVTTIAELAGPEVPIVGHNVSYDLTLLDREMRRLGIGFLALDPGTDFVMLVGPGDRAFGRPFPVIDTLVIDKAVDRYRPGKRRLEVTAAHYGVPMAEGSAHGAMADVIASLRIAITIANRSAMPISAVADLYMDRKNPMNIAEEFYNLGAMDLTDLHSRQVFWAETQAKGLREYFIKQGKREEAAGVNGQWPVRVLKGDESE